MQQDKASQAADDSCYAFAVGLFVEAFQGFIKLDLSLISAPAVRIGFVSRSNASITASPGNFNHDSEQYGKINEENFPRVAIFADL